MPFNFRIVFSGICAFVPDPDGSFDDPNHRTGFFKSVKVVLPNMRRAKAVDGGNARDSHLARIELDSGQGWVPFGRVPDLIAPRIGKDVYTLDNERVSFRFTGAATPAGIEIQNFPSGPCSKRVEPAAGEEQYFWWVPKMERVVERSAKIRRQLLEKAEEVIGWVELDRGSFSTKSLSPQVMVFKSIGGRARLRQRIASKIAVDVADVEEVEILFEKGGKESKLSLSLTEDVVIEIMNRELDHLLTRRVYVHAPVKDQPDVDFTTYYEMASVPAPVAILPHEPATPAAAMAAADTAEPLSSIAGLSIGGVCPPAAFSGSALEEPMAARRVDAVESKAAMRKRSRR